MSFIYRTNQRPLEGYTIKRGVGEGAFGQVYYALSDGGKEVALKLLVKNSDVELRGVANCLNLKHPNLVHVYDLKEDERGQYWLVMEYIQGSTLDQEIRRQPTGLPLGLVREWFGALARAVAYLHDRGIIHRDLKPGNIFLEAGTLKVGDYGLCKSVSQSQRKTRNIGTVHYMAPEIGMGNYNHSIDIYACGIILYEMLTGKVPFDGESDSEIITKHMTASVDLTPIPAEYHAILEKALHKNPVQRYNKILDFAQAFEAIPLPRAQAIPLPGSAKVGQDGLPVARLLKPDDVPEILPAENAKPGPTPGPAQPPAIPLARPAAGPSGRERVTAFLQSVIMAPLVITLGLGPYAVISQTMEINDLLQILVSGTLIAWAILLGSGTAKYKSPDGWGKRLRLGAFGLLAGGLLFWIDGWILPRVGAELTDPTSEILVLGVAPMPREQLGTGIRYLLYFSGVLLAGRWWKISARDRKHWFSMFPVLAGFFWSSVFLFLWPWDGGTWTQGLIPILFAIIAVQLASPWSPPAPPPPKKLRLNRGA